MSQKNPVQRLGKLKVLVTEDRDGRDAAREAQDELDNERPRIRADCLPGGRNEMRPCPWYGCKYHLGLSINEETGSIQVRDLDTMVHTCNLDVSEIGGIPGSGRGAGITLEECGEITDLTRERMRQIEFQGMSHMRPLLVEAGVAPADWTRLQSALKRKSSTVSEPVVSTLPAPIGDSLPTDGEEP